MSFNPDKCEVIHITNKRNPLRSTYSIHDTPLRPTDSAKYLGATITSNLSWKTHIENNTNKANSTLSFLRRNISSCPPSVKETAYKNYVRPIVEYAFVKKDYQRASSVTTMLQSLKWDTPQHRRNIARVTMLYKTINGLVDIIPTLLSARLNLRDSILNTSPRYPAPNQPTSIAFSLQLLYTGTTCHNTP